MSNTPTLTSLTEAKTQRTQNHFIERTFRYTLPNLIEESVNDVNGVVSATVANAKILSGLIKIHPDFLCQFSQMIPEDTVIFGGTLYKRSFANKYIRDLLTKRLPR